MCSEEHRARCPGRPSQARPSHLDLSCFFFFFFFLSFVPLLAILETQAEERKSIDQRYYTVYVEAAGKVRASPGFLDRLGHLCFSRPSSSVEWRGQVTLWELLARWLFLSPCTQPLAKRVGFRHCRVSPGRAQGAESWGSEGPGLLA